MMGSSGDWTRKLDRIEELREYSNRYRPDQEVDYPGYDEYNMYMKWSHFCSDFPYNGQLLRILFGDRDAIEVFDIMVRLPESKARELVERLTPNIVYQRKLKNMSDS